MNELDAELLQAAPLSQRFNQFLFDDNFDANAVSGDVVELLTAEKFDEFLDIAVESFIDDDPYIIRAIQRIATLSEVEFIEPVTPEDEFTRLATRAESEISSFIESNSAHLSIELLKAEDVRQIEEIYNPNNMLAFAKDLCERKAADLEDDEVCMILRYRNVIHRLNERRQIIRLAEVATANETQDTRVGARTWGGDIHPYGFERDGRIDPAEYNASEGIQDDPGVEAIYIAGERIKFRKGDNESI